MAAKLKEKPKASGDRIRERQAEISRAKSVKRREIGPLPDVVDPERKAFGRESLLNFCRTYLPGTFSLEFGYPHLKAIDRLERMMKAGGKVSLSMMRGGGKSALARAAVLDALLQGKRFFPVLFQATEPLAAKELKKLVYELETNPLLLADFPEVCYPIFRLDRISNRQRGQTLDGIPTRMEMTKTGITLPTVRGSVASGSCVHVVGITGAFKGLSAPGPNGSIRRPDALVFDDVQTRESARSPAQTAEREAIVLGDALGLAGPTTAIAAAMLCTPIFVNDLSERFLDPARRPEWRPLRSKMLVTFPADMPLWEEYREVRREGFDAGDGIGPSNEFYAAHRETMDAGATVSWLGRVEPGDLSPIQTAMNKLFDDRPSFMAEYQCEPEDGERGAESKFLDATTVTTRLSGLARGVVPRECSRVTAFIDCGKKILWWVAVAWTEKFGGTVIDYGHWPKQRQSVFAASAVKDTLANLYPGLSETALVFAGLKDLVPLVLKSYPREGGGEETVRQAMIDCGWWPTPVYQFIRQSESRGVLYPSKGIGRTATTGISDWKILPGQQRGWNSRVTAGADGKGKMVQFDPDAWKTFVWERMGEPMGGRSPLSLFGDPEEPRPADHALFAEHCACEYGEPKPTTRGTFDKWAKLPGRSDNHYFDCLVGCAVAAGVSGLTWSASGATPIPKKPRKKIDIEELYAKAQ
jgi:hypothetical protein